MLTLNLSLYIFKSLISFFLFFFASHSQVVALVFALFLRSVITQAKYDDSSDDERLSTINLSRGSTVETWEEE